MTLSFTLIAICILGRLSSAASLIDGVIDNVQVIGLGSILPGPDLDAYIEVDLTKFSPPTSTSSCNPEPNPNAPQYIIGYGSLIHEDSKLRTDADAGPNIPVTIKGYNRYWNIRVPSPYNITVLGVLQNASTSITGVIYRLGGPDPIASLERYDQRESQYCRVQVSVLRIRPLSLIPASGWDWVTISDFLELIETLTLLKPLPQFWIYINKPNGSDPPTQDFPIIQSYVDVFLSGCLDIQDKFKLRNYAENCVRSTQWWGIGRWCNDRANPIYPRAIKPRATEVDALLQSVIPTEFAQRTPQC